MIAQAYAVSRERLKLVHNAHGPWAAPAAVAAGVGGHGHGHGPLVSG
jgi:hypothetical protein